MIPTDVRDEPSRELDGATLLVDRRRAATLDFSTGEGSGLAEKDEGRR